MQPVRTFEMASDAGRRRKGSNASSPHRWTRDGALDRRLTWILEERKRGIHVARCGVNRNRGRVDSNLAPVLHQVIDERLEIVRLAPAPQVGYDGDEVARRAVRAHAT